MLYDLQFPRPVMQGMMQSQAQIPTGNMYLGSPHGSNMYQGSSHGSNMYEGSQQIVRADANNFPASHSVTSIETPSVPFDYASDDEPSQTLFRL